MPDAVLVGSIKLYEIIERCTRGMEYPRAWRISKPPYIIQQHAALLLMGVGLVGLILPSARNLIVLPDLLEIALFLTNIVIGLALYLARDLERAKFALFSAFAMCIFTAVAVTFGPGLHTGVVVYVVEA